MDVFALIDSLQRGLEAIPPGAIVLGLLGGPTAVLIGYRLMGSTRRLPSTPEPGAPPYWVCHACRSVNELRRSHCYRCAAERDQVADIEIVVEQPSTWPGPANVPAGSPVAAVATGVRPHPGIPVMSDRREDGSPVAVGPGRDPVVASSASEAEQVDLAEAGR